MILSPKEEFSDETLTLVRFKFMQSAPKAVLFNYPNHGPSHTTNAQLVEPLKPIFSKSPFMDFVKGRL